MGVYIKGMEMPKHCAACPIERLDDYGDEFAFYCLLNDGDTKQVRAKCRRPDCPLVPVPPHGRLIDESAIDLSKYEQAAHDALHNGKGSILYDCGVLAGARAITRLVRNAPTIIPAEEGET